MYLNLGIIFSSVLYCLYCIMYNACILCFHTLCILFCVGMVWYSMVFIVLWAWCGIVWIEMYLVC